jgi:hypothetical protein
MTDRRVEKINRQLGANKRHDLAFKLIVDKYTPIHIPITECVNDRTPEYEGELMDIEWEVVDVGKNPGLGITCNEFHHTDFQSSYGNSASVQVGRNHWPSFKASQIPECAVAQINVKHQELLPENVLRKKNGGLLLPLVTFGCMPGGGCLNVGVSYAFSESILRDRNEEPESHRFVWQYNRLQKIDKEYPDFIHRGYDWLKPIKDLPFYVLDQPAIDQLQGEMDPLTLKLVKTGESTDILREKLKPTLGGFTEKYLNGRLTDSDLRLATRLLIGLQQNEYLAVDGFANNSKTQIDQTIKQLELIQFLLNIDGKLFTFCTRPTGGTYEPQIVFLDSFYKGAKYEQQVPSNPERVTILDTEKELDDRSGLTDTAFELLKTELTSLKNKKIVNPVEFYKKLMRELEDKIN